MVNLKFIFLLPGVFHIFQWWEHWLRYWLQILYSTQSICIFAFYLRLLWKSFLPKQVTVRQWDPNTGGINLDILVGSVSSEVNGREIQPLLDDDVEAAAVDQPKLDLALHLHLGCTTRPLTWTWSGDMENSLISWGSWTSPVPELLFNFNIVTANASPGKLEAGPSEKATACTRGRP